MLQLKFFLVRPEASGRSRSFFPQHTANRLPLLMQKVV